MGYDKATRYMGGYGVEASLKKHPIVERWVLTPHAAARASERGVSMSELAEILRSPDVAIVQGPSKWLFAKQLLARSDNLVATAILERKDLNLWVVLTVMVNFEAKK